jgi:hypothetical protein
MRNTSLSLRKLSANRNRLKVQRFCDRYDVEHS